MATYVMLAQFTQQGVTNIKSPSGKFKFMTKRLRQVA